VESCRSSNQYFESFIYFCRTGTHCDSSHFTPTLMVYPSVCHSPSETSRRPIPCPNQNVPQIPYSTEKPSGDNPLIDRIHCHFTVSGEIGLAQSVLSTTRYVQARDNP
jgi:hypothetical protein